MNSSFYTDPIVDPLVHVKYESALSLGGGRGMAHETRSTLHYGLGINKIYREKNISMIALWCPAFSNHGRLYHA